MYADGDLFYFMDVESYDQIALSQDDIGDALKFVKENEMVKVCSHNGNVFAVEPPLFVDFVQVESAGDMFEAMKARYLDNDIIIKAAAVADYKPKTVANDKMKKKDGEMSIELDRTQDILKYMGEHRREGQFYCGFSMETQNMLENSRVKLDKKNIDMVVANNLKVAGSGFGTDTNVVTMISKQEEIQLELLTKEMVAHKILDEILKLWH